MAARYADSWKVQFATRSALDAAGTKLQNRCCTQLHQIGYYMEARQKIFKGDFGNKAGVQKDLLFMYKLIFLLKKQPTFNM